MLRKTQAPAQATRAVMKNRILILSVFVALVCTVLVAQQTRTEVTKSTTPFDDSKPNSDQVPEAYAISGQFERVLVLRFKHDTDLLAGIEKMVQEHRVRSAVVLAGIGSVKGYHLHVVSN